MKGKVIQIQILKACVSYRSCIRQYVANNISRKSYMGISTPLDLTLSDVEWSESRSLIFETLY